jgi:hypothetical protein
MVWAKSEPGLSSIVVDSETDIEGAGSQLSSISATGIEIVSPSTQNTSINVGGLMVNIGAVVSRIVIV